MNDIEKEFQAEVVTTKNGVISFDAKKAMFFVYKYHYVFGLSQFPEDERYDFIVGCLPVLERASQTYSPTVCPPFSYVAYLIRVQKKTWAKAKRIERFSEIANLSMHRQFYDESQIDASYIEENTLILKKSNDPWLPRRVLLLALVSSWYLTDRDIKKLSLVTKIDEETLHRYVDKLNRIISKKAERIEEENEKLSRVYAKHRRLMEEKAAIESKDENFLKLSISEEKQRKKWERITQEKKSRVIRTPMSEIAKLLGINQKTALRSIKTFMEKYDGVTLFEDE